MKYNNEIACAYYTDFLRISTVLSGFQILFTKNSVRILSRKKMASSYSQDQYYGEYLRYIESFMRLYNEVPPSFQNYLAYQKQEAMAVKEYQQKETSPSTSEASPASQIDVLVKL